MNWCVLPSAIIHESWRRCVVEHKLIPPSCAMHFVPVAAATARIVPIGIGFARAAS
jgi:hypothetical protein